MNNGAPSSQAMVCAAFLRLGLRPPVMKNYSEQASLLELLYRDSETMSMSMRSISSRELPSMRDIDR